MSAKHTQGPLVLGQYGAIRGGPMVRFINGIAQEQLAMTTGTSWMEPGEHLANARRLVACWNACEGLHTESLERGAPLADQIVDALNQRDELLAQRNQLLEALSYIEGLAMADEPRDLPTIATTAREAIAKVGGRKS